MTHIYDLISLSGLGYGIIGNTIIYFNSYKYVNDNINSITNVTHTTLTSDNEKIIILLMGMFPIYGINLTYVVNAKYNSCRQSEIINKDIVLINDKSYHKEKEYINTEEDFKHLCKKIGLRPTEFKMKFPITVTNTKLDNAFIGDKYLSHNRKLLCKFESFERRLPLSLTIITSSILLLGFSHNDFILDKIFSII
jgi:hypothetical protein